MHPGGGCFARRIQAGQRSAPFEIGANSSHRIMGGRADGNQILRDVDLVLQTSLMDSRKARFYVRAVQMRQVKINSGIGGPAEF